MSIQEQIELHKKRKVKFLEITRPQFICKTDKDFIDYIKYCWEFISFAEEQLSSFSFFNDYDHSIVVNLSQEVGRAHGILELCHKFLSGKSTLATKKLTHVYTTTISHERRG